MVETDLLLSCPPQGCHVNQTGFSFWRQPAAHVSVHGGPGATEKHITRTSSCGKGPREFSGTLMGGMTQSLFIRLSWSPLFRDGNEISIKSWSGTGGAGGAGPGCTCKMEKMV